MYIRMTFIGIVAGLAGAFMYNYFFTYNFVQVDILDILKDEQKQMVELVSTGKLDNKDLDKKIKDYLATVELSLRQVGKEDRVIIFQKGTLLNESPDYTEKLKKRISEARLDAKK